MMNIHQYLIELQQCYIILQNIVYNFQGCNLKINITYTRMLIGKLNLILTTQRQ